MAHVFGLLFLAYSEDGRRGGYTHCTIGLVL